MYQMALQVLKDTYIAEFEIVKDYAEGFDLHPPARVDVMVGLGLVRERRPMLGCGVGAWRRGNTLHGIVRCREASAESGAERTARCVSENRAGAGAICII